MKAISDKLLFSLTIAISLWVVFTSGYLLYADSEHPGRYLLAIAIMGAAWTIRHFVRRHAEPAPTSLAKRKLTQSIALAGVMLSLALVMRLGWIDGLGEFGVRARGIISGAIVVLIANAIPKQVSSARRLAMLRIAGWALVIGGLGNVLAWLL